MSTSFKNVTPTGPGGTATLLIVLSFTGFLLLTQSLYVVPSGQVAVVTTLGKVSGPSRRAGLNFKLPFVQSVYPFDIKTQVQPEKFETLTKAESLSNRIHYLLNESKAFIVLPGKIGTLTELFVAWNSNYLYNINKEYNLIPIYLKKDYWKEIIDNLPENMELDKQFLNYFESIEDLEEIISKLN